MFKYLVLCLYVTHATAQNKTKETKAQFDHNCENGALDPEKIPKEPRPIRYDAVMLRGCKPPIKSSYASVLASRNILIGSKLELYSLPLDARLTTVALADLPTTVAELLVSAPEEVIADPYAFASLDSIRHLTLMNVRAEHLPKKLDRIKLSNTGYEIIPDEALNAEQIMITSDTPVTFIGTAPRLQTLDLYGEMANLQVGRGMDREKLQAPVLDVLLLGRGTPEASNTDLSLGDMYRSLRGLRIIGVSWKSVPRNLLRRSYGLKFFWLQYTNVTQLPEALFAYPIDMDDIQLNHNALESLPGTLFSSLPRLRTLNLSHNHLKAVDMKAVRPCIGLMKLDLSENSLGDLCATGGKHIQSLEKLTTLQLSKTEATRVCGAWFRMPTLVSIGLEDNLVGSVACADLRGAAGDHQPVAVNLAGNPVREAKCSKADVDRDEKQSKTLKKILLKGVPSLNCNCGSYWLSRWLKLKVYVDLSTKYVGSAGCHDEWATCNRTQVSAPKKKTTTDDVKYAYSNDLYERRCKPADLAQNAPKPPLPHPKMFTAVKLTGCTVPKGKSYITALRDQNILVRDKLELIGLPYDVNFSKKSLAGLPTTVNYLHVSAKRGILVPERDTFAGLDQIQTLHLASVRPERLPKKVRRLVLEGAGYDVIPAEAMNAVEIKLSQLNPISLAGIAPRLETMNLTAPVTDLPFAPALETLILNGNRRGKMPVPAGLGSNCSSLVRLELRGLGWTELPKGLLREAKSLYYFVAVRNKFETLNVGVFEYDLPELSEMDLSGNGLIDLPNNLFSKLLGLNVVILDNNKLTARALRSLTPLTSLTHLHLSGNPLGDLCLPGGLSILPGAQFLQELHLSQTNATQVCRDYLLESRDLTWVDLSHNAIRSLSCDQLYVRRDYLAKPLHVELTSNPIATINCTKDDYETAAIQPAYPQRADIVMDSSLRCDCASYWLSEWVQLKVSVTLNPKYKGPCERKWTACKEETVHLIEQPIPLNYYPQKIYMQTCRTPEALANHKFKPKDHPIYYETVYLNHCNVDLTESLSDALRAVNVTLDKSLYLSDIPSTSRLTVAAMSNLPETLASLVISVSEGVMDVEPGALADLNTVGRLSLMRVRADRLPLHLDYLSLTDTGNCSLPDRALNAIQIMINEDVSVSMAGSAPRLRELTVSAPSVVLPDAPLLEKISLHYMKILLVGLFADTPALKEIDLSSNEIQSIPRWLFDGLNYLERLTLMNNNLITADVTILGTITSLKKLDLRRNPIEDLCDSASEPSPLKSLKELQILDLSTTNLTHTCSDWIDGLPALRWLHVSHNAIETAPCKALHATRDPKVFQPIIDLTGNPIGGFDCSKEDYRRPVKMASNQMVSLWTDEPLKCDCSNYWLVKILAESKNKVLYKPRFGNGICTVDMLRYC